MRTLFSKLLSVINFVVPIRTLRVKSNTKLWFDIEILNAIRNRDKHYKKFKWSSKKTGKGNFKCKKRLLKKLITKKNFILQKKNVENRIILKNSDEL